MKVLITGANGFVGRNLAKYLENKGFNLRCFDVNKPQIVESSKVEVMQGNLRRKQDVERAVKNVNCIVHLGAIIDSNNKHIYGTNVNGTEYLVEAARKEGVERFVFMSSENVSKSIKTAYTDTKNKGEEIVKSLDSWTILRPTLIYGPKDGKYITKLIELVKKYPIVPIIGSGKNIMQPIFIDDLILIIEECLIKNIEGAHVIAGAEKISYNGLVKAILNSLKVKRVVLNIPVKVLWPFVKIQETVLKNPIIHTYQLTNLEDRSYEWDNAFSCKPTPIKEGISAIIRSF